MVHLPMLLALLPGASLPDEAVTVNARLETDELRPGGQYSFVVAVSVQEDYSIKAAGLSAPILQIQVPEAVTLAGKVLTDDKDLKRNEYLQAPFERLVKQNPTRVRFTLDREPAPDAHFDLNVLTYVAGDDPEKDCWFVRRRLRLPLKPHATATGIAPRPSTWGVGTQLQLGDQAPPFSLPRADGSKLSLGEYLGSKTLVVTTYRAHW